MHGKGSDSRGSEELSLHPHEHFWVVTGPAYDSRSGIQAGDVCDRVQLEAHSSLHTSQP